MDELQAGRELDALVAEKVMGWHIKSWQDGADGGYQLCDEAGNYVKPWSYGSNPRWRWSPSTDIAAAWEVVETLSGHPHYFHISITVEGPPSPAGKWNITIIDKEMCCADDESAPLAICRAALEAVGQCES